MNGQPNEGHMVRAWAEKAEQDLRAAERLLESDDETLYDSVCFHAQQCAEKYLKAFLAHIMVEFPHTHDLRVLLGLINSRIPLDADTAAVIGLNRYAIQTRYPGDWEPIERSEAGDAVATARKVRDVVRAGIPKGLLKE